MRIKFFSFFRWHRRFILPCSRFFLGGGLFVFFSFTFYSLPELHHFNSLFPCLFFDETYHVVGVVKVFHSFPQTTHDDPDLFFGKHLFFCMQSKSCRVHIVSLTRLCRLLQIPLLKIFPHSTQQRNMCPTPPPSTSSFSPKIQYYTNHENNKQQSPQEDSSQSNQE